MGFGGIQDGMDVRFESVRESATGEDASSDRSSERADAMMETGAMETGGGGEDARLWGREDEDLHEDGDVRRRRDGADGKRDSRVGVVKETMVNPASVVLRRMRRRDRRWGRRCQIGTAVVRVSTAPWSAWSL